MKQPDFSIEFDLDNFPASFCAPTDRSDDDDVGVSLHSKGASKGVGQMMTSHGNTFHDPNLKNIVSKGMLS